MAPKLKLKLKLPKSVKFAKANSKNPYVVFLTLKKSKGSIYVGSYPNLDEAIDARDKFVSENNIEGYLPRGIAFTVAGKYTAKFSYNSETKHLGTFETLGEAIETRTNYIKSLI